MSDSLNSSEGESSLGFIKGHTRSLDYSSYGMILNVSDCFVRRGLRTNGNLVGT